MDGVNELKYRKDVLPEKEQEYFSTLPTALKDLGINYIDDLTNKVFTNSQPKENNDDWIRKPQPLESAGLYVKSDPNDPTHFGDPAAVGFLNNKSINEDNKGANRTNESFKIRNGQTSNSQGLYGIYGIFGEENFYIFNEKPHILWKFKFNNVSGLNLKIALMPEDHPKRWTPSNDGRDDIYDIIINGNSFKITPKGFKKVGDRWYSPIATLVSNLPNNNFDKKYLNKNYKQLYLKYKTKYLNLKSQLNK